MNSFPCNSTESPVSELFWTVGPQSQINYSYNLERNNNNNNLSFKFNF